MIIMISSEGESLQSKPNFRFGRTPYFIKYNLDDDSWEAFRNDAIQETGGAGVAASQFLINHKTTIAVSGRFGPNAHTALASAKIKMFTFNEEHQTVESVIESFKNNELNSVKNLGAFL